MNLQKKIITLLLFLMPAQYALSKVTNLSKTEMLLDTARSLGKASDEEKATWRLWAETLIIRSNETERTLNKICFHLPLILAGNVLMAKLGYEGQENNEPMGIIETIKSLNPSKLVNLVTVQQAAMATSAAFFAYQAHQVGQYIIRMYAQQAATEHLLHAYKTNPRYKQGLPEEFIIIFDALANESWWSLSKTNSRTLFNTLDKVIHIRVTGNDPLPAPHRTNDNFLSLSSYKDTAGNVENITKAIAAISGNITT